MMSPDSTGTGKRDEEEGREGAIKDQVLNIRADALRRRTLLQRALARVARVLAHPLFFLSEAVLHIAWLALNTGAVPGVRPWDPYPFSLLTGMASVQALFIGLLILMYAQHESTIAEIREEVDLQVALHAERETSKLLRMVTEVHHTLNVNSLEHDSELELMSQPLDADRLRSTTEAFIRDAERDDDV